MSKAYLLAAQAAGYASLMGKIEFAGSDKLKLPEGALNIGGNGQGYALPAVASFDPLAVENRDSSFTALALGDDVYIYAVQQDAGTAKWVASKNATYPTGYTATNSRKVGGFHFGRVRPVAQKYNKTYTCLVQIVPNSVWDIQNRPTCDPTGMVEIVPGKLWADIYLSSIKSGTDLQATLQSKSGAVPVTGTEGFSYTDLHLLLANSGKRSPNYWEFVALAYGMPNGATGQTGRINTAAKTGYGFDPTSCKNVDQPSGNLYQTGAEMFDLGYKTGTETYEWQDVLKTGKDSAHDMGKAYSLAMRMSIYGASWNNADFAGSRAVSLDNVTWSVHSFVGARGVCDSL